MEEATSSDIEGSKLENKTRVRFVIEAIDLQIWSRFEPDERKGWIADLHRGFWML